MTYSLKYILILVALLSSFSAQATRALYVDDFAAILNNSALKTALLQYAEANEFDHLILYELHIVHTQHALTNATTNQVLADFIIDAKSNYGISKVTRATENAWFSENRIIAYNNTRSAANEKIDGLTVEFEFWNTLLVESSGYYCTTYLQSGGYTCDVAGAYAFCKGEMETNRSLVDNSAHPMTLDIYLGWPDSTQLLELADLADHIFLHAYVTDPNSAFSYTESRLTFFENYTSTADIMIIYSAEPNFSGSWLQNNNLQTAEDIYRTDYNNASANWKNHVNLQDFVYFTYTMMTDIVLPLGNPESTEKFETPNNPTALQISPNPTNEKITLVTDFYLQPFRIYNAQGQTLDKGASLPKVISVQNYPSGLYFLQTRRGTYKFVKN